MEHFKVSIYSSPLSSSVLCLLIPFCCHWKNGCLLPDSASAFAKKWLGGGAPVPYPRSLFLALAAPLPSVGFSLPRWVVARAVAVRWHTKKLLPRLLRSLLVLLSLSR